MYLTEKVFYYLIAYRFHMYIYMDKKIAGKHLIFYMFGYIF